MKKYILKNNAGEKINETEASSLIEALNYFAEVEGVNHYILSEAVAVKKQEWINEQAKKSTSKTAVLENKIAKLEAAVKSLTEGKKK